MDIPGIRGCEVDRTPAQRRGDRPRLGTPPGDFLALAETCVFYANRADTMTTTFTNNPKKAITGRADSYIRVSAGLIHSGRGRGCDAGALLAEQKADHRGAGERDA